MVILVTGISGTKKDEYLKKIAGTTVIDIENELTKIGMPVPWSVDVAESERLSKCEAVWWDVARRVRKKQNERWLIHFHAAYWRRFEYLFMEPRLWDIIKAELKPDYIITLINNVHECRWYLREENKPESHELGFRAIISWRLEEITFSRLLAQYFFGEYADSKHILLATQHPVKVIENLIAQPRRIRVYAAFPVSLLDTLEEEEKQKWQSDISQFISKSNEHFVTFNPYSIFEKELGRLLQTSDLVEIFTNSELRKRLDKNLLGMDFWPKEQKNIEFSLSRWEIFQVLGDIDAQILSRDRMMVRQSDMVIALHPEKSRGAKMELRWAKEYGKERFAVGDCAVIESAMFSEYIPSANIFANVESLFSYFAEQGKL